MHNEIDIQVGDEVRALSTDRRMVVRGVEGDWLLCAWFDGLGERETRIRRAAVRRSSAAGDARVVQFS